jgi:hypothetical protein
VSFSDLILTILVLTGVACVIWVLDVNPYSKNLQVYTQTCDNMVLENTYCKGNWQDNPVTSFSIDEEKMMITRSIQHQSNVYIYPDCSIKDRKNWVCEGELTEQNIIVSDGIIIKTEDSDTRQITRLQWLQNKILEKIS